MTALRLVKHPPSEDTTLDLVQSPFSSPYREAYALGWILAGPVAVPAGNMFCTSLMNPKDDADFHTFLEIMPEKAIQRALEAARTEKRAT